MRMTRLYVESNNPGLKRRIATNTRCASTERTSVFPRFAGTSSSGVRSNSIGVHYSHGEIRDGNLIQVSRRTLNSLLRPASDLFVNLHRQFESSKPIFAANDRTGAGLNAMYKGLEFQLQRFRNWRFKAALRNASHAQRNHRPGLQAIVHRYVIARLKKPELPDLFEAYSACREIGYTSVLKFDTGIRYIGFPR